jgi:hypothetical protein
MKICLIKLVEVVFEENERKRFIRERIERQDLEINGINFEYSWRKRRIARLSPYKEIDIRICKQVKPILISS